MNAYYFVHMGTGCVMLCGGTVLFGASHTTGLIIRSVISASHKATRVVSYGKVIK